MSQPFNNHNGNFQNSPPNRTNTGVEGLMSSLISPGPGTPMQAPFPMPWMNMTDWNAQSTFAPNTQNQLQQGNQVNFEQNNEDEYTPYEPSEAQYNRGSGDTGQNLVHGTHVGAPQFPQAQSAAVSPTTKTTPSNTAADAAENAKRLKELRARLMAKKPKDSRDATPTPRPKLPTDPNQDKAQPSPRLANKPGPAQAVASNGTVAGTTKTTQAGNSIQPSHAAPGVAINNDLDNLFAEVRNESSATKSGPPLKEPEMNGTPVTAGSSAGNANKLNGEEKTTPASNLKELHKDLNKIKKKLNGSSRTSSIVARNPGSTLDELVAAKKIMPEQKASIEKRPALQDQLAQTERAISEAQQQKHGRQGPTTRKTNANEAKDPTKLPPDVSSSDKKTEQRKRVSSADLSDGEIRSDDESAPVAAQISVSKKPPSSSESSHEAEEKSRRESEVEAAYQPPAVGSRDSQEKLRRQSQVTLAYSPLKRSSGSVPKPPAPPIDTATPRKVSGNLPKSPKSAVEQPSRPWVSQKGRTEEYDRYVPSYRKPALNERQGADPPINLGKRTAAGDRTDVEERRKVEQNEKAAAVYKKALDARPQPPSRVISHTETTYLGRVGEEKPQPTNAPKRREPEPVSPTQALTAHPDMKDWLELTDWYDEEHRERRLSRFRKRRELDLARFQLEQEEQLEMQQRSLLRSAAAPDTPRRSQMPPPTLPPTHGSNDATKAPDQVAQPTLKRQHAEDDTDARNKVARVDTSRPSFKDESSPSSYAPVPLEHRISRDDNQWHSRYRPRSRSPDRYRRRSASPERRRFSVPEHGFVPTCHNCGVRGHYKNQCTEPFRDGRDRFRQPPPLSKPGGYQRFGNNNDDVSPNYQGKNPQKGFKDPRASRHASPGRGDDDRRP